MQGKKKKKDRAPVWYRFHGDMKTVPCGSVLFEISLNEMRWRRIGEGGPGKGGDV